MNEYEAYQSFWEIFRIPAYDETTVPDGAELPYITYNVISGSFDETVYPNASIWYKGTSWKNVTEKALEIEATIGIGGVMIPFDGGFIWIKKGSPVFMRRLSDVDDQIRRIILDLEVEFMKEG